MIKTSDEYKRIMKRPVRNRGYSRVEVNLTNQEAQDELTTTTVGMSYDKGSIFSYQDNSTTYAAFEDNYIPCDGSFKFWSTNMPNNKKEDNGFNVKDFFAPFTVTIDGTFDISGITIDFGQCYPTEFIIAVDGDTMYYFTNDKQVFTTSTIHTVSTSISITPTKFVTDGDNKRLHIKSFILGEKVIFENSEIENINIESFVSQTMQETSYINGTISLFDEDDKYSLEKENAEFFAEEQPIDIYFGLELDDESIEWHKSNRVWLKEWNSHNNKLTLTVTDRMSRQEGIYELGYVNTRRYVGDELQRLFEDCGFANNEFSISKTLYYYYLDNPVPKVSHKDALQMICNAFRCIYYENENGTIVVKPTEERSEVASDYFLYSSSMSEYSDLANMLKTGVVTYADMSTNMIKADGSTTFYAPTTKKKQAFVSANQADADGNFATKTYVEVVFPMDKTCHRLEIDLGNPTPKKVKIRTRTRDFELVESFEFTTFSDGKLVYEYDFATFNRLAIECVQTEPYARFVVNHISLDSDDNYYITRDDMYDSPSVYKDSKIKKIVVQRYKYTDDGDDLKEEKYGTEEVQVNSSGMTLTCENQITYLAANARAVARWLQTYYETGLSYELSWRGDPSLQIFDNVHFENKYGEDVFAIIEKNVINYNGAWSGNLELRKISNITESVSNLTLIGD